MKNDWVVEKEYRAFTSDRDKGVAYSNPNIQRRRSIQRSGVRFIGFDEFNDIACEGSSVKPTIDPLTPLYELFGVVTLSYPDKEKFYRYEESTMHQKQLSSPRLV